MAKTIAEIGLNHGGVLRTGALLIEAAARAGCDFVKFQTYRSEDRAPSGDKQFSDLLRQFELTKQQFLELKKVADINKIEFISTPFDIDSARFLIDMGCTKIKISSFDNRNLKYLEQLRRLSCDYLISAGMAGVDEIKRAVETLTDDPKRVTVLHCVSAYPTPHGEEYLGNIRVLKSLFPESSVGHSDHTPDILSATYAAIAGASVIEKHFKLNEAMSCVDSAVSITESQMKQLVINLKQINLMFQINFSGVRPAEEGVVKYRRVS